MIERSPDFNANSWIYGSMEKYDKDWNGRNGKDQPGVNDPCGVENIRQGVIGQKSRPFITPENDTPENGPK